MITLDAPRASDLRASLSDAGVTGAAQEAILRETSHVRHAWRVAQAKEALLDAAVAAYPPAHTSYCVAEDGASEDCACFSVPAMDMYRVSDTIRILAGAIASADAFGIGGRDGVGGDSTLRVPALRGLGKGRKHAADGPAWSAAIAEAGVSLAPDCEWAAWDGHLQFGRVSGPVEDWTSVLAEDAVPYGWLMTIAREGLRRAIMWCSTGIGALREWHTGWETGCAIQPMRSTLSPADGVREWARVVNALDAARTARCSCNDRDNERPADALLSDVPTCPGCFGADGAFAATAWGAKTEVPA